MWWYAIFYCLNFQNQFRQVFLIVNITAVQLRKVFYKWKNLNVNDFKPILFYQNLRNEFKRFFYPNNTSCIKQNDCINIFFALIGSHGVRAYRKWLHFCFTRQRCKWKASCFQCCQSSGSQQAQYLSRCQSPYRNFWGRYICTINNIHWNKWKMKVLVYCQNDLLSLKERNGYLAVKRFWDRDPTNHISYKTAERKTK